MAESTDIEGFYKVDVIADLFGVSVRRIQQLTQDGIIATTKTADGRRYELEPTVKNYVRHLSDKAHGKSKSESEAKLKEQKLRAEIALKESQGELHRLRTEIAVGKYISVEEVKLDYSRFFVAFKKFAMSLPRKLTRQLSGAADPVEVRRIESELRKDIQRELREFVVNAIADREDTEDGRTKED